MMKTPFWPGLVAGGLLLVSLNGCADQGSQATAGGAAAHRQDAPDPKEIPPRYGMTRSEVLAQYGQPRQRFEEDQGETWVYLLNGGEIVAKSFIPFYIPPRPRTGVLMFGPDGRVVRFRWHTVEHD